MGLTFSLDFMGSPHRGMMVANLMVRDILTKVFLAMSSLTSPQATEAWSYYLFLDKCDGIPIVDIIEQQVQDVVDDYPSYTANMKMFWLFILGYLY